jgi:hypothetical protein
MIDLNRIASFTKYSSRYYNFTNEDCARIKSSQVKPFGWVELLSDQYGNLTTDDVIDPKVWNALNEGRSHFKEKNKVCPNCYLASHNGERGVLILGVDNVLIGTQYEKTDRSLIDIDKLIARSCDKAEMDDQYEKNHPLKIDFQLKIFVRTGFIIPDNSVGIFIFVPENSPSIEYFTGRVKPNPLSRIWHYLRHLYEASELEFNPNWRSENMEAGQSRVLTL